MTVDKDEKSALLEGTSTSQNSNKIEHLDLNLKVLHAVHGVEVSTSKISKLGGESVNNTNALLESKEKLPSLHRSWKRRCKFMATKVVDEENRPAIKGKDTDQFLTQAKQSKLVRSLERDLRVSTAEVPLVNEVNSSTGQRSRHKKLLKRSFAPEEKSSENIWNSKSDMNLNHDQDWALFLKEELYRCLSSYLARRWCVFEWFYSAIDYPWFSKREFIECLSHVDLEIIPRLTRVEWSVIKSSLGKPRRLSEQFLREERQKLTQYRESVRKYYNEVWTGTRDGLPADLAKPLHIGQQIIALHSKTREIHDGSVLSVDYEFHDKYLVQFNRLELGVEAVMDIDCMPLNPLDNMPETMRWKSGAGNVPCRSKGKGKKISSVGGCKRRVSSGPVEKAPTSSKTSAKHKMCSAPFEAT